MKRYFSILLRDDFGGAFSATRLFLAPVLLFLIHRKSPETLLLLTRLSHGLVLGPAPESDLGSIPGPTETFSGPFGTMFGICLGNVWDTFGTRLGLLWSILAFV